MLQVSSTCTLTARAGRRCEHRGLPAGFTKTCSPASLQTSQVCLHRGKAASRGTFTCEKTLQRMVKPMFRTSLCLLIYFFAMEAGAWNYSRAASGAFEMYTMTVSGATCAIKYINRDNIELEVSTEFGVGHAGSYTASGNVTPGTQETGDPRRAFRYYGCDQAVGDLNNFSVRCVYMRSRKAGFPTRQERELYNCPS